MEAKDTRVSKLAEMDRRYVWHPMARLSQPGAPMMVAEGDGAWITDTEGNRYLDGMAGLWYANVGYGREELARAAYEQLQKLPNYPLTLSHEPAVRLGEKLNEWLDDEYVFFFSNSGSEANEVAFKMTRQYHLQRGEGSRHKFIARYRAYHGTGGGALAATGMGQRKYRYEPLSPGFLHVQPPMRYRCGYCADRPACTMECAREIERTINWEIAESVAGVIMEPIITGGGIILPPEGYVENVAEICRESGALLIMDEVICGFGRTGKKFGHQHYGVKPDIVTMAKAITSGYLPLSATAIKREFLEAFKGTEEYDHFRHVNTFGGNTTSCALALRNLEIMEDEGLPERSAQMGEKLGEKLSDLEDHPNVGEIRHKGLLLGIELVEDKGTRKPAEGLTTEVFSRCKDRGLIVGKTGDTTAGFNNVITLSPPLIVTEDDLEFMSGTIREAVNTL